MARKRHPKRLSEEEIVSRTEQQIDWLKSKGVTAYVDEPNKRIEFYYPAELLAKSSDDELKELLSVTAEVGEVYRALGYEVDT